MNKIILSEIFQGIQGEGLTQGKNSLFLRFSNCNLSCGACDSMFTWKDGEEYDLEYVYDLINKVDNVVFTGGEPLLDDNWKDIIYIINNVGIYNKNWEVETNGSIKQDLSNLITDEDYYEMYPDILFNISPKGNFNQAADPDHIFLDELKKEIKLLEYFNEIQYTHYIVKFLFENEEDFEYIENMIKKYNIPNYKIYLQPKATTEERIKELILKYYDYIIEKGWNISFRSHIWLFGNKRGV